MFTPKNKDYYINMSEALACVSHSYKLYDEDAYKKEFDATVIKSGQSDEGCFAIFNQTLFFPEEGGQSPDKGFVCTFNNPDDKFTVVDVQIHKGMILHFTDKLLPEGSKIHGEIDFHHRFSNMQQHSAEHIFSGLMHSTFGADNVGFHLSDNDVTMDFKITPSREQLAEIEKKVNEAIWKNVSIKTGYPSKEEIDTLEYRSKKELSGPVRIVCVEGYDVCACCAPHVSRTGEIGLFKIIRVISWKGGIRIFFLAGERAFTFLREKYDILSDISSFMTTSDDKVLANITSLKEELQKTKFLASGLKQELMVEMLKKDIVKAQAAGEAPKENLIIMDKALETVTIKNTVKEMMELCDGYCAVFSESAPNTYAFMIGSTKKDCRLMATALKEHFNAKCGGASDMIQGSVSAVRDDLLSLF